MSYLAAEELGTVQNVTTTADKIRALRLALPVPADSKSKRLTQEAFGKRCGLTRTEAVKLEMAPGKKGANQATSDAIRGRLATDLGLSREELSGYIDGDTPLKDIVRRITEGRGLAPTLAQAVARNPGVWTGEDVAIVESTKYRRGRPEKGWEAALDEARTLRERS